MRRVVGLAAVLFVASVVLLLAIASRLDTAAERAERGGPPPLTMLTAGVERRQLSDAVVVRGRIEPSGRSVVRWHGSAQVPVVTREPPAAGELLIEGAVLIEVSGRPVFTLLGEIPAFRDLRPGDSGRDVEQLQAALDRLGLLAGGFTGGELDRSTGAAIELLYQSVQLSPPIDLEAVARIEEAEARSEAAADAVEAASEALDDHERGTPRSELEAAKNQVESLERQLELAKEERDRAVRRARAVVKTAQQALEADQDSDQSLTDALDRARDDLASVRSAHRGIVADARGALHVAKLVYQELLAGPPVDESLATALKEARMDELGAAAELDRLRAAGTVMLPLSEFVFIDPSLTKVEASPAEIGSAPPDPIVSVVGADMHVEIKMNAVAAAAVEIGSSATISHDKSEFEARGLVAGISAAPELDGDAGTVLVEVAIEGTVPDELSQEAVVVSIESESTERAELVVPAVALQQDTSGLYWVRVLDAGTDSWRRADVDVLVTSGGFVAVRATTGDLNVGDAVVTFDG